MKTQSFLKKSQKIFIMESTRLCAGDPVAVFRFLRDRFQCKDSAFFCVSDSTGDSFSPALTILGFEPLDYLQCKNGMTTVRSAQGTVSSALNPFQVLEQELLKRKVEPVASLPFFQGGALGYLSYDAVRFLETKLGKMEKAPALDGASDAELIFFRLYLVFDHRAKKGFLIHAENPDEAELRGIETALSQASLPAVRSLADASEIPVEAMSSMLGKEKFLKGVLKLKENILDGDIFQAVLSDRFLKPFKGKPLDLFEALCRISPAPYQFFFEIEGRSYLGASPEMLIKVIGDRMETHPIAGTRPRGKNAEEELALEKELIGCVKEKAEHLMLVDLARNDVGRVSLPGSVKVDSFMEIRKYGGVMHLVSTVSGKLGLTTHPVRALASCFPAGTLSGAPKIRAMELISEIEGARRGFYGGAFIAASVTGDLDSCITIRSISVENEKATIQVGAGIVADSVPEMEYAEIQHKSSMTRKALALIEAKS